MQTTSKQGLEQDGVGCSLDLQDLQNLPWIALRNLIRGSYTIGARSCKVLQYSTFGLGRLSKLPFSAKSQKLTRGVRHGRAQVVMAGTTSTWPGTALLWPGTG
ncbi:hypothetical protein E3N88_40671 [Mikania micrantha]|uniref:Uncharacterized protein n=1 Tax=Mikania micrantha TaxID=192012 RepID=A0A5N6LNF1_9ASTR|nr:hypothetical protein E3N88_40671 [Mikania micrantha]